MSAILRNIDVKGGVLTALVVGSALIAINQWDALFYETPFSYSKAALTYVVPFLVYQYGRMKKQASTKHTN